MIITFTFAANLACAETGALLCLSCIIFSNKFKVFFYFGLKNFLFYLNLNAFPLIDSMYIIVTDDGGKLTLLQNTPLALGNISPLKQIKADYLFNIIDSYLLL